MQPNRVVVHAVGDHVEIVTAHAAQDAREAPPNLFPISPNDLTYLAINSSFQGALFGPAVPLGRSDGTERRPAAVAENDFEAADMVDGLAVNDGARAGRVVAHHAAQVGAA